MKNRNRRFIDIWDTILIQNSFYSNSMWTELFNYTDTPLFQQHSGHLWIYIIVTSGSIQCYINTSPYKLQSNQMALQIICFFFSTSSDFLKATLSYNKSNNKHTTNTKPWVTWCSLFKMTAQYESTDKV